MKFVNTNKKHQFRFYKNKLWVYGYSNYTDEELFNKLESHTIPQDIRGQFAYVYIDNDYWIGCVDHFASTNLYYSNDIISDNLQTTIENTQSLTECKIFLEQKEILKMYTVGPFTRYNEIQQIMQEHVCVNHKQIRYMDLLNENNYVEPDYEYDKFIVENLCNKITNPVVVFSGGKDSAYVAMALKHFNKNPKLIKIHSDNVRNRIDIEAVKDYKNIGWDVEYFNVNSTRHFPEDTYWCEKLHWHSGQFSVKRHAVKDKGDYAMSGEVSGSTASKERHMLTYINNTENANIDDITNFWINGCKTHLKDFTPKSIVYNGEHNDGYNYIIDYYRKKWNRIDKSDFEKVRLLFHIEHSSSRLWAESQDTFNTWFNIFADYDLQKSWLCLKSDYKKDKKHMRDSAKLFDTAYTDISWNYKNSGMAIKDGT